MKHKAAALTLLLLMSAAFLLVPTPVVEGQSPVGFTILQVVMQGEFQGITSASVDDPITVNAGMNTFNGPYTMFFDGSIVETNNATGYYVASNFTVPHVPAGAYTITLQDDTLASNTTYSFEVITAYIVEPVAPASPLQLQEGNDVTFDVAVTGGEPNTQYNANITLKLPEPLNTTYSKMVSLTTSDVGTAQTQITFPDSTFTPSGSTTNYAGTYKAYFNLTDNLAQKNFDIGITDKTQYIRQETVTINAVDYQPSQTATLTITHDDTTVLSQTLTASSEGKLSATWQIPSTATLGTYNVTITTQNSPKAIVDSQTFELPGAPMIFQTVNLAGEPVNDVLLEVLDHASGAVYSETTGIYGTASMNLEEGDVTVSAYLHSAKVGETQLSVKENGTYTITCSLTNLEIRVREKNGVAIPFVDLDLYFEYTTRTGATESGYATGQTNSSGIFVFPSTLPNVDCIVNASKYGAVFNLNNNTISDLPEQPSSQVTILCPEKTLALTVVDSGLNAVPNSRIVLTEQDSGLYYTKTADGNGAAQLSVVFGRYDVSVYTANDVLLNQTTLTVTSNTQTQIKCVYNLDVSVKVVDYFGAPISGINVQLSGDNAETQTATTQGDGTVVFTNLIGGTIEIAAYPSGDENSFVATSLQLDSSTDVQLALAQYVALGSLLVDASLLLTLCVVLAAVLLFLGIELYRRKRR
ncbi:MAG: hypothetical protein NWF04_08645 [Candidatus Bathyarchaeota archaeon]|nr:hypothetical protein [Candidatus Bathyarchaeota archaeon]